MRSNLAKIDFTVTTQTYWAVKAELCRRDFIEYRKTIHPDIIDGWWWHDAARHLMQFYLDTIAGKRPILVIQAPPQHGKSELIVDFISWIAGHEPNWQTVFASFSERLGVRSNLKLQRIFDSTVYRLIFPKTKINVSNKVAGNGQYLRNKELLEYVGHKGYFRNTTVGGPITGESLDMGVIDDPIKGRAEANSDTIREKNWNWLTDDMFTRFSDKAALLIILTRWHEDDVVGRLINEKELGCKVISYKAIAEKNEKHRKAGEALFPQLKSLEFLLKRKALMLRSHWEALYQQNPIIGEGNFFAPANLIIVDAVPKLLEVVRYWDKAGTEGGGAYTAGCKIGRLTDGRFIILDITRGQWGAGKREKMIKLTAETDGYECPVWIEQEPGSGGKESAENTISNLAGWPVRADPATGSKVTRAIPVAAQIENGNVLMLRAEWNGPFIKELLPFPNGKYKDQCDALSGAFNKLTQGEAFLA